MNALYIDSPKRGQRERSKSTRIIRALASRTQHKKSPKRSGQNNTTTTTTNSILHNGGMVSGRTGQQRMPSRQGGSSQREAIVDEEATSARKRSKVSQGRRSTVQASDDDEHDPSSDAYVPEEATTRATGSAQKDSKKSVKSRGPITYGPAARFGLLPHAQFITQDRLSQSSGVTDVADQTIFRKSSENERRYIVLDTDTSIEPYRFRAGLSTRRSFLDAEIIEDEDEEDDELHRDPSVSFTEGLPPCHDGITFEYEVESESAQRENNLPLYESISLKDASGCEARSGCIINAGSYVYSTDWAPNNGEDRGQRDMDFLAIAAALTPWQRSNVTERLRKGSAPATVQIWSIAASGWRSALSMVLCFDGGRISSVRWCPTVSPANSGNRSLGIVAIAMQDGGVGIYDVPDPSSIPSNGDGMTVYLKPTPLIFFDTNRGVPMALAWYNSAMLAVAYSDGYVGVWDVKNALTLTDTAAARPSLYARISRSPLSDITWDAQGSHIYSSALDGSVYATSLDQPDFSTTLAHSRDVAYPIAYDRTLGAPIFERLEDASIRVVDFHDKLASRAIYPHYGRVRALCTSPHHPFVASGSADGSVKTANVPIVMENHRRWAGSGMTTIFRLDMTDRESASLRFVDGFMTMPLTREPPNEVQVKYGSGKDVITGPARFGLTMGWHPAIGVTTVRWNTNVGRETWLATGLGVGLVRVDMVGR